MASAGDDDDVLSAADMAAAGRAYTLASIMDESDDSLDDLELDADVAEALAAVQGAAAQRKSAMAQLDAEVEETLASVKSSAAPSTAETTDRQGSKPHSVPPSHSEHIGADRSMNTPRNTRAVAESATSNSQADPPPASTNAASNAGGRGIEVPTSDNGSAAPSRSGSATSGSGKGGSGATKGGGKGTAPRMTTTEKRRNKHGKVLRSLLLSRMSQHMASPSTQREVGIPTVICVRDFMAIGTGRGFVLVYEANQNLRMILGTVSSGSTHGAVTAIASNFDNTRLLVGHESGHMVRWDLTSGKQINAINCHPRGVAVTGLAFMDDHTGALSNNAQGFVYQHHFKRVMGMRTVDDTCLWPAKQGEVCLMQVLHEGPQHARGGAGGGAGTPAHTVVALGQLEKILIAYVKADAKLKVALQIPRNVNDGDQIPSLSWMHVPIKTDEDALVWDPVLAFGWGRSVRFMQLIDRGANKPKNFKTLGTYASKVPVISIRWLSERVIMTMDRQERVHVIDVTAMVLVDIVDLTRVQLTFNDKFSIEQCKARRRDARAPSLKAYDNAIASIKGNIYLLGMNSVHLINIMKWRERVQFLTTQNKFVPGLELAMAMHDDTALAVVGMPKSRAERKKVCRATILDLLQTYVTLMLKKTKAAPQNAAPESNDYYTAVARICVDFCFRLDAHSLLLGAIYTEFARHEVSRAAFLELLEPLILEDKLTALDPDVVKDMIVHYQTRGKLKRLEECVLHLDVQSVDLHQMVVLCWTHGLYDAMIYIYNRGLNDYVTPLKELLKLLAKHVNATKSRPGRMGNVAPAMDKVHKALGYKLLLYTDLCLRGKAFPTGDIPAAHVKRVKSDVYRTLLAREDNPTFPYVRTLLLFDTREFLNVLVLAFEATNEGPQEGENYALPRHQTVVDIMLEIMVVEPTQKKISLYSPEQVGQLFTFLARQIARKKQHIRVDSRMYDQVLEYLSNPDDTSLHEERQQALLELLNLRPSPFSDPVRLLRLAREAKFYRVCQLVYERRGEHSSILECYLLDEGRQSQAFEFIHRALHSAAVSSKERTRLREQTVSQVLRLTLIDPTATARLLLTDFQKVLTPVVATLNPRQEAQFHLLEGLFKERQTLDDEDLVLSTELHEQYIDLRCRLRPHTVYTYLRENAAFDDASTAKQSAPGGADVDAPVPPQAPFRLKQALELTRRYRITDATAWLLERLGDHPGAFSLIHDTLQERIAAFNGAYITHERAVEVEGPGVQVQDGRPDALAKLRSILAVAMQMCLRASARLDEVGRARLWFALLDAFLRSQNEMKNKLKQHLPEYTVLFRDLTRHVVNSMINYVALPAILQKVMSNDALSKSFGEIKDLIMGLVDTYAYERTLLHTTNLIVANDLYWTMRQRLDASRKGVVMRGRTLRRRQEDELRRGKSILESFGNEEVFDKLQKYQAAHESLPYEALLGQLEAFRHGEGPPPLPRASLVRDNGGRLNLRLPRIHTVRAPLWCATAEQRACGRPYTFVHT
eukprot:m.467924 g.467924  ORF g.467924 m.467924 type:complete len:1504 (-) comp21642_c1_seq29:5786-10297(-)